MIQEARRKLLPRQPGTFSAVLRRLELSFAAPRGNFVKPESGLSVLLKCRLKRQQYSKIKS
jgi:hypothetical protein